MPARKFATNEQLDYIAALLDDMWRIPGTQIRFGLDALIGWVPGLGDYRLLIREKEHPGADARRDWIFLAILFFTLLVAIAVPIAMLYWIYKLRPQ